MDKIDRLESNDKASRNLLFAKFRHSLESTKMLNPNQKAAAFSDFEAACVQIENQYASSIHYKVDKGAEYMTTNPSQQPELNTGHSQASKNKQSSVRNRIVIAMLFSVVCAIGSWFYFRSHYDGEFSRSVGSFSSDLKSNIPLDLAGAQFKLARDERVSGLEITGSAVISGSEHISIDTSKSYAMEVRLKVIKNIGGIGSSIIWAGFATYDKNGNLQLDAPGAHRYFAGGGPVSANEGWQQYFGIISGEGNSSHNQFRVGTKSAVPVLVANYQSPDAKILVDYIRVIECNSAANCQKELEAKWLGEK